MSIRNRALRASALLALAVMLGRPASVSADVLAERVPADATIYVGWQGSEALQAQYEKSNLKAVIDASEIPAWLREKTDWAIEKIKKEAPEAEAAVKIAMNVGGKMWKHPTALYIGPFDFSKVDRDTPPMPRIAVICDAGADADALIKEVEPLIKKANDQKIPVPLAIKRNGNIVTFGVGKFTAEQSQLLGLTVDAGAALRQVSSLKDAASYKAAMAEVDANAAVTVYMDMTKVEPQLAELVSKIPDKDAQKYGPKIIKALGLNGFTQMAVTGNFSGKEWAERGFVGLTGEKKGLAALFDIKPLPDDALKIVPKDAVAVAVMRVDLPRIYDEVRAGIKSVEPDALKGLDQGLALVRRMIDIDVAADVIAPLGDTWTLYRTAQSGEAEPGIVLAVTLKDEKKFAATLAKAEEIARDRGLPLPEEKAKIGDAEASVIALGQAEIAWGIYQGRLIVSTKHGFEAAVKQMAKPTTSIVDNPKFAALRKTLGGGQPISLDFHDPAKTYPEFAKVMAQLMFLGNLYGAGFPDNFLPEPEKIEPFLTPGGSVSWIDAKGLHTAGRSAFPGSSILGQNPSNPAATTAAKALFPKQ